MFILLTAVLAISYIFACSLHSLPIIMDFAFSVDLGCSETYITSVLTSTTLFQRSMKHDHYHRFLFGGCQGQDLSFDVVEKTQ